VVRPAEEAVVTSKWVRWGLGEYRRGWFFKGEGGVSVGPYRTPQEAFDAYSNLEAYNTCSHREDGGIIDPI